MTSAIAASLATTTASIGLKRPCWPAARTRGEKNPTAPSASSPRVGPIQDAYLDLLVHSQMTEHPSSRLHRSLSGGGTQQGNDEGTTAHETGSSFFWCGFDTVRPRGLRQDNHSVALDGLLVWNEEVDADTGSQWQEMPEDASDTEAGVPDEAFGMLSNASPPT